MLRLSPMRLRSLKAIYSSKVIASLPKAIRRRLAQTEKEIEKLKATNPRWLKARIDMLREFRLHRSPEPPPSLPAVPDKYRSEKISHWYRDHLTRLENMTADAVCRDAVKYDKSYSSGDLANVTSAFNAHIEPIAKLYGFELQMKTIGNGIALYGDIGRAHGVLLYLCRESRTPETDWLMDVVVTAQLRFPEPFWKGAWNKLRHTKRGKWWRKIRDRFSAQKNVSYETNAPTLGPKIERGWWRDEMDPPVTSPGAEVPTAEERNQELIAKQAMLDQLLRDAKRTDLELKEYPVNWPHNIESDGRLTPEDHGDIHPLDLLK